MSDRFSAILNIFGLSSELPKMCLWVTFGSYNVFKRTKWLTPPTKRVVIVQRHDVSDVHFWKALVVQKLTSRDRHEERGTVPHEFLILRRGKETFCFSSKFHWTERKEFCFSFRSSWHGTSNHEEPHEEPRGTRTNHRKIPKFYYKMVIYINIYHKIFVTEQTAETFKEVALCAFLYVVFC